MKYHFNIEGSDKGMWSQIEDNASGRINTWAIFWYASIFLQNGLCLAPSKSLVKNVGFDNSGVHCGTNPAQEIQHNINIKINSYPQKIRINKKEFRKNIAFLNKMHGNTFRQKLFRITKNCIRTIVPAKFYNFVKTLVKG